MDKVTQAMLANKAAALKGDVNNFGGFLGGDDDEEAKTKADDKRKEKSLKEWEERRERQRAERDGVHRKREEEREKMRSDIRNKYKLKGSHSYDETDNNNKVSNEHELAQHSEEICQREDKNCAIQ